MVTNEELKKALWERYTVRTFIVEDESCRRVLGFATKGRARNERRNLQQPYSRGKEAAGLVGNYASTSCVRRGAGDPSNPRCVRGLERETEKSGGRQIDGRTVLGDRRNPVLAGAPRVLVHCDCRGD